MLTIAAAATVMIGCEKKQEQVKPAVEETKKPAATTAAGELQKAAETVKTTTEKTVADATKQVESATVPPGGITAKAQEYIDKAKTLVTDKKYQDALTALQQLSSTALSPDQQKAVDDLTKTIQAALGNKAVTDAAAAAGNLLKK